MLCVFFLAASPAPVAQGRQAVRESIRLALPSKGRMAEDTLMLLKVRHARAAQGKGQGRCARRPWAWS